MSTATHELQDGTLAANFNASGRRGIDPRRRRFALNPGIYHAMLDPRESGRQEILLPSGLVTFRTTEMANDDFDNALKNGHNASAQHRQIHEDVPAEYFLRNFIIRYGDQGVRELQSLTMMEDPQPSEKSGRITKETFAKSAHGYFAALWPAFADIGHVCPADLKECATCRLWLIGDPSEDESMQESALDLTSKLEDQGKVEELREEVVAVLKGYIESCETRWAAIVGELADRKNGAPAISKLGPGEHHVRRNLHETEPSEAATAASFGMEVAQANAEATRELAAAFREGKGGPNDDVIKMILENQKQQAEILARLSERLPEPKDPA